MNILALGLSAEELNRAFPGEFQTENGEFYSDYMSEVSITMNFNMVCTGECQGISVCRISDEL